MKKYTYLVCLLLSAITYSQVGINTEIPVATLDVVGDPTDPLKLDGIIAPRLSGDELSAKTYTPAQTGAMVYVTAAAGSLTGQVINVTAAGYYYFDGTVWVKTSGSGGTAGTEPWFDQATDTEATANTQNIYQMGNVAVGKTDNLAGTALDVEGAVHGGTGHTGTVGPNSVVFGTNNQATGLNAVAFGGDNTASDYATAFGSANTASAFFATAFGTGSTASGSSSTAFGNFNEASGSASTAFGDGNEATGQTSTAFGTGNIASGMNATAFGENNQAIGVNSFAAGQFNVVNADASTVTGSGNTSNSDNSFGFISGNGNIVSGTRSAAFGAFNTINSPFNGFVTGQQNTLNAVRNNVLGQQLVTSSPNQTAIGRYNAIQTWGSDPSSTFNPNADDPVFQVGVGSTVIHGSGNNNLNAMTILHNMHTGIGIYGTEAAAKPTEMLDIGSEGVRIRDINTATYAGNTATDKYVVADATGVLKTVAGPGQVNYELTSQETGKLWVDDSPVYEVVGDITLATNTNVIDLSALDFPNNAWAISVRFINKVTNSVSTNIISFDPTAKEMILGTAGSITTLHPAGDYYIIIEYVNVAIP